MRVAARCSAPSVLELPASGHNSTATACSAQRLARSSSYSCSNATLLQPFIVGLLVDPSLSGGVAPSTGGVKRLATNVSADSERVAAEPRCRWDEPVAGLFRVPEIARPD